MTKKFPEAGIFKCIIIYNRNSPVVWVSLEAEKDFNKWEWTYRASSRLWGRWVSVKTPSHVLNYCAGGVPVVSVQTNSMQSFSFFPLLSASTRHETGLPAVAATVRNCRRTLCHLAEYWRFQGVGTYGITWMSCYCTIHTCMNYSHLVNSLFPFLYDPSISFSWVR